MTVGQAHEFATLNALIKWSLLVMIVVLVAAIAQYTAYQPWWRDPVGTSVVMLEIFLLAEIVPQEYAQFFVHSVSGTLRLAFAAVGLSMLVTVGLMWRIAVWWKVHRDRKR